MVYIVSHMIHLLFNNILVPRMIENKYIASKGLRTKQRKVLLQKNRVYLRQCEQYLDKNEFNSLSNQNSRYEQYTFIDPNYYTFIETFAKAKYKYSDLILLVSKLSRDVFSQYDAVIGIYNVVKNLFTNDNELQVMGSGIIPSLIKIIVSKQHPFLQFMALSIILRLIQWINRDHLHVFFNNNIIPYNSLLVVLNSQIDCLAQIGLNFLAKLLKSRYFIEAKDDRVDFLQVMQSLVLRWPDSPQKLKTITLCLIQLDIYFWTGRYKFNQKLFNIMEKMISLQKQRQAINSVVIITIIRWITDKKIIRSITNVFKLSSLEQVTQKHNQLYRLVESLYNFRLDSKCLQPKDWSKFILNFLHSKQGLLMLQKMKIIEKILQLMKEYKGQNEISIFLIKIFLCLLNNYLSQLKQQQVKKMMKQKIVFILIKKMFESSATKQTVKIRNSAVTTIIKAFKFQDHSQFLLDFDLISSFIKSSVKWDNVTIKTSFKCLRQALQQLKTYENLHGSTTKSINIQKIIVRDENMQIIRSRLISNYLEGSYQLKNYFQDMKNRLKQNLTSKFIKNQSIFIEEIDKNEGYFRNSLFIDLDDFQL